MDGFYLKVQQVCKNPQYSFWVYAVRKMDCF